MTGRLPSRQRGGAAFSLIEILVTMALLTMIVLGLLLMFNQTQRAFRTGLGQTDVLEGGRGAVDMVVRQLEQLTPSETPAFNGWLAMNFWSGLDPNFNPSVQYLPTPAGTSSFRTNVIDQFFLLTRANQDWIPLYYRVQPAAPNSAVGSLFCYTLHPTNSWPRYAPVTAAHAGHLLLNGNQSAGTFYLPQPPSQPVAWSPTRLADGIIHFQLRAFDTNGVPLIPFDNLRLVTSRYPFGSSLTNASSAPWFPQSDICCWSNAVPAYLELEMGILESKTLQHYLAIDPKTPAAQNYLSNHVSEVHLFRQRIPIRNVDFSAYQ